MRALRSWSTKNAWPWGLLGHGGLVLLLFFGLLAQHQQLYYRDISLLYVPNYTFAARWLGQGIWPLWNPDADAGAQFLLTYPVDLLLLALFGVRATMAWSPALHLLWMMQGTSRLAGRLGHDPRGAWLSGALFGLSGIVLSSVPDYNFQAMAWCPWVLLAVLRVVERPLPRAVALLAGAAALEVTTLGGDVLLQTALLALFLLPRLPRPREALALSAATLLAALLAAPAVLGMAALVEGTERGQGFGASMGLAFSANLPVLLESLVPRLFGDVHTFSSLGYWGQPFYPEGTPYYPSLYLGPGTALLALLSLRSRRGVRLWLVALLGILLCLGGNGPLAPVLRPVFEHLRSPVKLFFMTTLALCLMAGSFSDWKARSPRHLWLAAAGLLLLATGGLVWRWPHLAADLGSRWLPQLATPRAEAVVEQVWPRALATTGGLLASAGLSGWLGGRFVTLALVLLSLDPAHVNVRLVPSVDASFYDLRPGVARLLEPVSKAEERIYSYGVANSPPLPWHPNLVLQNRDVWLFLLDRQTLLPRCQMLDGFQGAFDIDRTGWAPVGSALSVAEATPLRFRAVAGRFRGGNVRWVLSFHDLPPELVRLHDQMRFPEVGQPLKLYEVIGARPRALYAARHVLAAPDQPLLGLEAGLDGLEPVVLSQPPPPLPAAAPDARGQVSFAQPDPHTVRLRYSGPPGFIVVLEGYHRGWRATDQDGAPVPLLRADGRYWAIPTPGGERSYVVRYRPGWLMPSLASCAAGLVIMLGLWLLPRRPAGPATSKPGG